jgi:hypothetical protein
MGHEHVACALRERRQIRQTPSGAERVFHDAPEACAGMEVRPTRGREAMEAPLALRVIASRVKRMRPMDAAALDDHPHLFASLAAGRHPLMAIWTSLLGSKVRNDCRDDCGGALLASADDAEQHAPREAAPRAVLPPRLPWGPFVLFALALAQRACGQALPLGAVPPAQPGQGTAPHARCLFIEQDARPSPCALLPGSACKSASGESSRRGMEPSRGTAGAERVVFQRPRTLSRPSWIPVCWASTGASARPLPWEARAPGWRGA